MNYSFNLTKQVLGNNCYIFFPIVAKFSHSPLGSEFLFWWRNSGYNFKWSYSFSLLLTLNWILFRNKWWHWKHTFISSTIRYSILKGLLKCRYLLGRLIFVFWFILSMRKKVLSKVLISEMPENKYLLSLYFQESLFVNRWRKADKQSFWMQREKTVHLSHRLMKLLHL